MCFGGGGDDSSEKMIEMQKQEAAEARAKEEARQARIKQGLTAIRNAFQGTPVMKNVGKKFDWGKFTAPTGPAGKAIGTAVSGLPAGYTYVQVPGAVAPTVAAKTGGGVGGGGYTQEQRPIATPVSTARTSAVYPKRGGSLRDRIDSREVGQGNSGQQNTVIGGEHGAQGGSLAQITNPNQAAATAIANAANTTTPAMTWAIKGPDGKIYNTGDVIGWNTQEDTGKKTGGFNDAFYNDFKQDFLDAFMPQVKEQFGDATKETLFRHALAGTLNSSAKIGTAADLTKQNILQEGNVQLKADTATTDLKNRVAKEQAALENQLYATENPDVAANATLAAVENINAVKPDTTPLGEIFTIAAIGGANAYKGLQNAQNRYGSSGSTGGRYGATSVVR